MFIRGLHIAIQSVCICTCLPKVNDLLCWTSASGSAICSYTNTEHLSRVLFTGMCASLNPPDTLNYTHTQRHTWRLPHYLECHVSRWGRPFGVDSSLTKRTCTWPSVTCCFPAFPRATGLAPYLLLTLIQDQLALVQACLLACLVVVNQWYWICDRILKTFLHPFNWTIEQWSIFTITHLPKNYDQFNIQGDSDNCCFIDLVFMQEQAKLVADFCWFQPCFLTPLFLILIESLKDAKSLTSAPDLFT